MSDTWDVDMMNRGMAEMPRVLNELGFPSLRRGQDAAVGRIMAGVDTICLLPTGGGKSAIYVVPTRALEWRTLAFFPLVSLMQDQVESLWQHGYKAAMLNSAQSVAENNLALQQWSRGELQFLLVAPERLRNEQFMTAVNKTKPDCIVVDEAHCVSQWSDNFRPDYLKVKELAEEVTPKVIIALSATMTGEVEADVRNQLGIPGANRVMYYPKRENLTYEFYNYSQYGLRDLLNEIQGPTIVYCPTKKQTHSLFEYFKDMVEGGCLVYNGGMQQHERTSNQNQFMNNEVRVMFATNAFGMGVNKPDIRGVIHIGYPANIEQYVQEAGRAGRDGGPSRCVLMGDADSIRTQEWFIENGYPEETDIRTVFKCVNSAKDTKNEVKLTINDVSQRTGISTGLVTSAMQIMVGYKVLERGTESAKMASIKFLEAAPSPMFEALFAQIEQIGFEKSGFWEFNLDHLCQITNKKPQTLGKNLKDLEKDGVVTYVAPFRGKVTTVISDVAQVDFERIRDSRREAYQKLDRLKEFCRLGSDQKHQYLEDYFS